jgi:hypothetical protein
LAAAPFPRARSLETRSRGGLPLGFTIRGFPLVDGGSAVVSREGVTDGVADGPAGGYSILEADDLAAAAELLRDHPFVGRGGELQVSQAVAPA